MSKGISKNIIFQTAYQILNTCLPLITAPYLARVLGARQLGVFSYTSSVVAYFALLAMLGTVNYGTRSVASAGEDKNQRSVTFWEIYVLQIIATAISILCYGIYNWCFCKNNQLIAIIQTLTLIGCLLDINWLFFGCEKFKITVTRSFFIRIATVLAILIFVKDENDLWIYTLIMLLGSIISNAILWKFASRVVNFKIINIKQIKKHIKPNLILFIPLLAMSVYHIMDQTMMGVLSTYEQSGFYYNADKVINVPLGILNGVGTVMLPRMTALFEKKDYKEAHKLLAISLEGIAVVGVAMAFGISAISPEFTPEFFGGGYDACIILIMALSPALLIKGFSNTIRTQYLIPIHKEFIFTKSVVLGAIINLIMNFILIPKLGAMGAVLGTVFAELGACVFQFYAIKIEVKLKRFIVNTLVYILIGLVMFLAVRGTAYIRTNQWILIGVEILVGMTVYMFLCIAFWKLSKSLMYEEVFAPLFGKFIKIKKY